MDAIFPLRGVIKHYDWGGTHYIPHLLLLDNPDQKPFAEYWMGVHSQGMATVGTSYQEWIPLNQLAHGLPFLLKVLDVKDMLSIQVHPSKAAARLAFEQENAAGIPLDAPHRNYKDNNHKPELMVALSEFWLLHGFKEPALLRQTLQSVAALRSLLPVFEEGGYAALYRTVMQMPQQSVDQCLQPHLKTIIPAYQRNELDRGNADFWAARAALTFTNEGHADRGIFSIYLFNLVQLQPGQAVFQDAGVPHAYLEGQNVEIMANSDNVLRGGLTNKHIDVDELMKHVRCEPVIPRIMDGGGAEHWFETPVSDFRLGQITLSRGESYALTAEFASILLCMSGAVELKQAERTVLIKQGEPAAFMLPDHPVVLTAASDACVFCASEGFHSR